MMPSEPLSPGMAYPATPRRAATGFEMVCILGIVGVTIFAMSLGAILHYPALHIFGVCDRFEMVWVATATNPAKMVECETFRDRPPEQFVSQSVSGLELSFKGKHPVSAWVDASHPNPATRFGDHENMAHKLFDWIGKGILVVSHCDLPQVTLVRAAQRLRDAVRPASIIGPSQSQGFQKLNKT